MDVAGGKDLSLRWDDGDTGSMPGQVKKEFFPKVQWWIKVFTSSPKRS